MDARALEPHKENIQPLPGGRPALKLGAALSAPRLAMETERARLERSLTADDLDDPLQAYLDYLEWTHCHFPQGNNTDSGLLALLERCTLHFRDTDYYKNDPRYLKVWLEYVGYSDQPRDIFVYLAKKRIGLQLALYYEEFARFLEAQGHTGDARTVFEIGLERHARPEARLRRNFARFCARSPRDSAPGAPASVRALFPSTPVLDLRTDTDCSSGHIARRTVDHSLETSSAQKSLRRDAVLESLPKRPRLEVYSDPAPMSLRTSVFAPDPDARLNSVALRTKENTVAAQPWVGQVLTQKLDRTSLPRFEVFRDPNEAALRNFDVIEENGAYYTMVQQPGKPKEKLAVNLNLLYPSADEEYSLAEVLMLSRKFRPAVQKQEDDKNETFTIALRDDETIQKPTSLAGHSNSPTITMVSRVAANEVLGMFNAAAQDLHFDDSTRALEDSTNYDGFVTETLDVKNHLKGDAIVTNTPYNTDDQKTPPTDHYDSDSAPDRDSSPFLEWPRATASSNKRQ